MRKFKNNVIETLSQFIFMILLFIVVILVNMGITHDWSVVRNEEFWIKIFFQLLVVMLIFNIIYKMSLRNRKHDVTGRFFKAYATNRLRRDLIAKENLHDKLEKAVENKNQELLESKCNNKLHKICTRIYYKDVMNDLPIEELSTQFKINVKKLKSFEKLVVKIRQGRISIKKINPDVFKQDKELVFESTEVYDFNKTTYAIKENAKKMVTYVIITVLMATVSFSFVSVSFWTAFVTNITLFISGAVSGFACANNDVSIRTSVYENRNAFLDQYLGLNQEWVNQEKA